MEFDKRILHMYKSLSLHGNFSVSCSFCKVIMELFKQILNWNELAPLHSSISKSNWCVCQLRGHGILWYGHGKVMEKSWNFVATISWQPCFQSSIKYRKIINPSATTSKIVQFINVWYEMKIKDFKGHQSWTKDFQGVLAPCTKERDEPHSLISADLRKPPTHIPIGLWLDCSNDTRFVSLLEMSFTDPPWWP